MRTLSRTSDGSFDEFVCFNTILEIVCSSDELIVFDSARYGRNHSLVAAQCDVPYTRNCDIDVHFSLNRACAGKTRCSMAVNTAFFGDPCGYEEFLRVVYRCVPGRLAHSSLPSSHKPLQALPVVEVAMLSIIIIIIIIINLTNLHKE